MKTLYLECNMGASGDMIMGALWELLDESQRREFLAEAEKLKPLGIEIKMEKASKCGIFGTKAKVLIHGEEEINYIHEQPSHSHRTLGDIQSILKEINLPLDIKSKAMEVYTDIALAEAKVHNVDIDQIHFHEVGNLDAIADVVLDLILVRIIGADRVVASPIATGRGFVNCAHGTLPVPAPATALILRGIPMYYGDVEGELCTPTGAAILKNIVDEFKTDGIMNIGQVGYGLGDKDFGKANVLRAVLLKDNIDKTHQSGGKISTALELSLNVDDMTGEELGFAIEKLMEEGALDCWAEPIFMKKNRPAYKLCVITLEENKETMVKELFKHTKTIGIRETKVSRYILDREEILTETSLGDVTKKVSSGFNVKREKFSYEDLKAIAKAKNLSLEEVRNLILEEH